MAYQSWVPDVPVRGRNLYVKRRFQFAGPDGVYIRGEYRYESSQVWRIVGFRALVTTDATVANRAFRVQYFQEATSDKGYLAYLTTGSIIASQTNVQCQLGPYTFTDPNQDEISTNWTWGINSDFFIIDDDLTFQLYLGSGKAGDAVDVTVLLKYMNPELGMKWGADNQQNFLDLSNQRALQQSIGHGGSLLTFR